MSDTELEALNGLPDHILRRAKHCVSEHRRTERAALALKQGDMKNFGYLMTGSHISMRDDFEITISEIDSLVDDAVTLGALGARMTGGGFGGCIVACVPSENTKSWTEALLAKHPKAFNVS